MTIAFFNLGSGTKPLHILIFIQVGTLVSHISRTLIESQPESGQLWPEFVEFAPTRPVENGQSRPNLRRVGTTLARHDPGWVNASQGCFRLRQGRRKWPLRARIHFAAMAAKLWAISAEHRPASDEIGSDVAGRFVHGSGNIVHLMPFAWYRFCTQRAVQSNRLDAAEGGVALATCVRPCSCAAMASLSSGGERAVFEHNLVGSNDKGSAVPPLA